PASLGRRLSFCYNLNMSDEVVENTQPTPEPVVETPAPEIPPAESTVSEVPSDPVSEVVPQPIVEPPPAPGPIEQRVGDTVTITEVMPAHVSPLEVARVPLDTSEQKSLWQK